MAQNKYDDPEFFDAYSQLPRSVHGLDGAAEWPALRALLPPLQGARVVDLGCGYGWFCRFARTQGAAEVLGLDVSEKMLDRARLDTGDPAIRYEQADLDVVELPASSFDLAFSSLTLHYLSDLARIVGQMAAAVVPGGSVVCSVEHPIFSAPSAARLGGGRRPTGVAARGLLATRSTGDRLARAGCREAPPHHRRPRRPRSPTRGSA